MKHLLIFVVIVLFAMTSCLGHRNSASRKSASTAGNVPDQEIVNPMPGDDGSSGDNNRRGEQPSTGDDRSSGNDSSNDDGSWQGDNPSYDGDDSVSPVKTNSPTPTNKRTDTPTPAPNPKKSVTPTVTATATDFVPVKRTSTPTPTPRKSNTPTPVPNPKKLVTPTVTATATDFVPVKGTFTPTPTRRVVKTSTNTPTPTRFSGQIGVVPTVTPSATITGTPSATSTTNDPFQSIHPRGITLVPSLTTEVAGLYSCGNYMYAVTKYSGAINTSSSVKQVLHRLKIANRYNNKFTDASLKKSGSKEAAYLLEGLTCVNNQWLAGTYRFMDRNVWYEYLFIYDPLEKTVPVVVKIHTSASTTDLTLWRTSDIRNANQSTATLANDVVKPDLIKVVQVGDDIVLTVFKEGYKFDRIILSGGSLNDVVKAQNNSLLASYNSSSSYFGATIAKVAGTNDLITAKLEKGSTAPSIYRWNYKAQSGKKITLSNVLAVSGKPELDANVISFEDKTYLVYRSTKDSYIKNIYDLTNLSSSAFDGKNNGVSFLTGVRNQGKNLIEQVVYANDGVYAFINTSDKLMSLSRATYVSTLALGDNSTFPLPARYTYLVQYKELKKISSKYASSAPFIAGGIGSDEVYLSFPYGGKYLTYKGRLSEFVEWSNQK